MEEFGSLWSYQESMDELKQRLLYTSIELETLKVEAIQQMRKNKEDLKHLMGLLKMAYKERDEAKDQLHEILNKLMPLTSTELHPILPQQQPEIPLVIPIKANSSITESNSLSDTYNHHSHGSSPVDSFFDAVTSPDFSSINTGESSRVNLVNGEYNGPMSTCLATPLVPKMDPVDAAIDNLINGKVLPEKGKLLQAVSEAGPLLQTLLVAGPLPRWRNPPPLQTFKIPTVSIKPCDAAGINNQKPIPDISRGFSQMCSASMLNFTSGASASGLGSGWQLSAAVKRQRFH